MPLPGSRFCGDCRAYAARRTAGPAQPGNKSVAHIDFDVAPCSGHCCTPSEGPLCTECAPAEAAPSEAAPGPDARAAECEDEEELEELKPGEEDVFLVEKLVKAVALTKQNSTGHSACKQCVPPRRGPNTLRRARMPDPAPTGAPCLSSCALAGRKSDSSSSSGPTATRTSTRGNASAGSAPMPSPSSRSGSRPTAARPVRPRSGCARGARKTLAPRSRGSSPAPSSDCRVPPVRVPLACHARASAS